MSLVSPLRSTIFAKGSEFYELHDEWDSSVTGGTDAQGNAIAAWSGDFEYFGYVNISGKWIIQRHQISTGQYLYLNGPDTYRASWLLAIAASLSGWTTLDQIKNTVP